MLLKLTMIRKHPSTTLSIIFVHHGPGVTQGYSPSLNRLLIKRSLNWLHFVPNKSRWGTRIDQVLVSISSAVRRTVLSFRVGMLCSRMVTQNIVPVAHLWTIHLLYLPRCMSLPLNDRFIRRTMMHVWEKGFNTSAKITTCTLGLNKKNKDLIRKLEPIAEDPFKVTKVDNNKVYFEKMEQSVEEVTGSRVVLAPKLQTRKEVA